MLRPKHDDIFKLLDIGDTYRTQSMDIETLKRKVRKLETDREEFSKQVEKQVESEFTSKQKKKIKKQIDDEYAKEVSLFVFVNICFVLIYYF